MKGMYAYLKFTWWQALLAVLAVITRVSLDLSLPDYMSRIIDDGILKSRLDVITQIGLSMLGIAFLVMIIFFVSSYLAAFIGSTVAHKIRLDLFKKIESFSLVEFDYFSSASLITRATNDVAQVQQILTMSFRVLMAAPLYGAIAFIKAYQIHASMALVLAILIPFVFVIIALLFKWTKPRFSAVQKLTDTLNRLFRESLLGIRVVRAFNAESYQEDKIENIAHETSLNNIKLVRSMGLLEPSIQIIMSFGLILLVSLGATAIQSAQLQVGQLMAFIQYSTQVTTSLLTLSMVISIYPRAAVSGQRISEILNTSISIEDPLHPIQLDKTLLTLTFDQVNFSYPLAPKAALSQISFTAYPNTVTAIIGSTGSGKSTLMHLILRLYDPSSGSIYLNGVDLKSLSLDELHQRIAYVPQKAQLFSGELEASLLMGQTKKEDAFNRAIEIAQAKDFIFAHADGLKHNIAFGATNLSGGQRQRLSIARALISDASIYLFDDSFSALDFKTDANLRKALHPHLKDATVFIVGQRVSSIMDADQILVMDQGHLVASGTHQTLMESCQVYQEIAQSQLSISELR